MTMTYCMRRWRHARDESRVVKVSEPSGRVRLACKSKDFRPGLVLVIDVGQEPSLGGETDYCTVLIRTMWSQSILANLLLLDASSVELQSQLQRPFWLVDSGHEVRWACLYWLITDWNCSFVSKSCHSVESERSCLSVCIPMIFSDCILVLADTLSIYLPSERELTLSNNTLTS